jgi:hypothetical protein
MILASDTQENAGMYKGKVSKWAVLREGPDWRVAVGGAGSSSAIELFDLLYAERLPSGLFDYEYLVREAQKLMKELYEEYVWPVSHSVDNRFDLLLAIQHLEQQLLVSLGEDLIPKPNRNHVHAGAGRDTAKLWAERLYPLSLRTRLTENVAKLAVFVTRQVKDTVVGVGGDTLLRQWGTDFTERTYSVDETWEMENDFEDFGRYLEQYWEKKMDSAPLP